MICVGKKGKEEGKLCSLEGGRETASGSVSLGGIKLLSGEVEGGAMNRKRGGVAEVVLLSQRGRREKEGVICCLRLIEGGGQALLGGGEKKKGMESPLRKEKWYFFCPRGCRLKKRKVERSPLAGYRREEIACVGTLIFGPEKERGKKG